MEEKHLIIIGGVVLLIIITILILVGNNSGPKINDSLLNFNLNQSSGKAQEPTELQGQDVVIGTSAAQVKQGDTIVVNYIASLVNGQKFESTYDQKKPFEFQVGANNVIPGFDRGVVGMKIGGKRKLLIPAAMAYGSEGHGAVPPNSSIILEIELVNIIIPTPSPSQDVIDMPDIPVDNNVDNNTESTNATENNPETSSSEVTDTPPVAE